MKKIFLPIIFILILIKKTYSLSLFYEIYLGPLKVGESQIIINKGKKAYHSSVYTTGLGNVIYPYYATWEAFVDNLGYPLKSIIYSKDRHKERKKILYFDPKNSIIREEKILPEPKIETKQIHFPIYDELTGFIATWNWENLSIKNYMPLYIKGERTFAEISIENDAICNYLNKEIQCKKIKVILPEKSELLKRTKYVTIIIDKEKKIPIEMYGKLPLFGSLKAILKNHQF